MAKKRFVKKIISGSVVQRVLIYISGGWIALEMTDYFIQKYELNSKISDVLSIILLIGLPIAIFLAWYLNREKEQEDVPAVFEPGSLEKNKSPLPQNAYRIKRSLLILTGILIVIAVAITIYFQSRHQSRVDWAREVALPQIGEIAGNLGNEKHQSWIAFNLLNEVKKVIPDDPLLLRLDQDISWTVGISSQPSQAKVYYKPYSDLSADWQLLGESPIDSVRLPRGLNKIKLEKIGFRSVNDLIWDHYSFRGNSLHVLLPEATSIPKEMEFLPDTALQLTTLPWLPMPGLEHIAFENTGDFLMDRFEVSNEEFKQFVDLGGYRDPSYWKFPFVKENQILSWEEAMELFTDQTGKPGPANWQIGDYPDDQEHYPVTGVSWHEAAAYAEYAGKSLPSIFHWARAAFTSASSMIVPLSNINDKGMISAKSTQSMNRLGIYNLAGNVREWNFNPSESGNKRFILGGSWSDPVYSFVDGNAQSPFDRSETNGFRCIKYLGAMDNKLALEKPIPRLTRDFYNEAVVSDEIFELYLKQYQYDHTPLHPEIADILDKEDYTREKITFDAAYGGERMMAYLFVPKKGIPPYQTVVLFPGSGSIFRRSSENISTYDAFIKSGRAVLFPIYKGTYERGDELNSDIAEETNFYKEHVIMWGKDLGRAIDYLETREEIDTDKIAYFGFSWGGFLGSILPAVEPRIKASILFVAGLQVQRSFPEVDPIHYLPRIKIPVLMLNGKYDYFFPYERSQLPFYELLGTPKEHKKIIVYEQGHSIPQTQLAKESLIWLDRYLGPVE
jgi:dienelactone hydrolase